MLQDRGLIDRDSMVRGGKVRFQPGEAIELAAEAFTGGKELPIGPEAKPILCRGTNHLRHPERNLGRDLARALQNHVQVTARNPERPGKISLPHADILLDSCSEDVPWLGWRGP